MVVAFAFLEEAAVLGVEHMALGVEDHESGIAEALGLAQTGEKRLAVTLGQIDVDLDKVVGNDLRNLFVLSDEVGKAEAPLAPVAADLTDDVTVGSAGRCKRIVDLGHRIDTFVVDALDTLSLGSKSSHEAEEEGKDSFLHKRRNMFFG